MNAEIQQFYEMNQLYTQARIELIEILADADLGVPAIRD